MELVRFEDVYGNEAYVNADHVTFLRAQGSDSTEIFVSGDSVIKVKMTPAQVASQFGWSGTNR